MTREDVLTAHAEAMRFIEAADALLASKGENYSVAKGSHSVPWDGHPSRLAAALKRRSLDLSVALRAMRRRR